MHLVLRHRWPRWPGVAAALAVTFLVTGCQGSAPTAVASHAAAGAPSGATSAAGPAPITVTVAPALVAPGAVRTGTPVPTVATTPPSAPSPMRALARGLTRAVPCVWYPSPKQIPLQVATGSGTATVSWLGDGDSTVTSYRISAVSQQLVAGTQPPHPTVTIARGAGCTSRSATLTGLGHRVPYVFWLEEARGVPGAGSTQYTLVGTSAAVIVP